MKGYATKAKKCVQCKKRPQCRGTLCRQCKWWNSIRNPKFDREGCRK